jgi:hypothetical protein
MTNKPPAETDTDPYRDEKDGSNPFVGDERKSLVEEIVIELRKDSVKEDARAKLKKTDWPASVSKFFQHPAVLLVIGFALTGVIGALLTSRWQRREWNRQHNVESEEWNRQQRRLVAIKEIDAKYGIVDELTRAVGSRNAAVTSVITPMTQLSGPELSAAQEGPMNEWQKAVYAWRVSSQTLRLKIAAHIKDVTAANNFKEIAERGRIINVGIIKLQAHLRATKWSHDDDESSNLVDQINTAVEETDDYLKKLTDSIVAEARADVLDDNR